MSAVEKTPAKHLHEALVTILLEAAPDLVAGGRPVTVFSHLPDQEFTQKALPMVIVERPSLTEESPWGGDYDHHVYTIPLAIADGTGPRPGAMQEARERIELLLGRVKQVLHRPENRNLRLAWLHVLWSLASWDEGETELAGNNLAVKAVTLSVPMHVPKGGLAMHAPQTNQEE